MWRYRGSKGELRNMLSRSKLLEVIYRRVIYCNLFLCSRYTIFIVEIKIILFLGNKIYIILKIIAIFFLSFPIQRIHFPLSVEFNIFSFVSVSYTPFTVHRAVYVRGKCFPFWIYIFIRFCERIFRISRNNNLFKNDIINWNVFLRILILYASINWYSLIRIHKSSPWL